jgi:hypothetical protein
VDYRVDVPATEHTHLLTKVGEHCVVIRAVDTNGLASPWADQVCVNVQSPPQKMIIRFVNVGETNGQ